MTKMQLELKLYMLKNILNRVANSFEKSKAFFIGLFDRHVGFGHVILLSNLLAKNTLCFKYVHKKIQGI